MTASGVWLGNLAWPSGRSCADFARDGWRISGAKSDKQKALAFYDWLTRCMMRGPNLRKPDGAGGYSRCYDPLPVLASWGHGECTFWGWIADECLNGAGLRARRVVVHNQGHTYYEVFYAGDDGVEGWHAFDPFGGWYFLNERGEVASCAELAGNPQLVQNPLPGHPVPLGHHPDHANLAHRHRTEDQIIIDQPRRGEALSWDLEKGMEVTMNFMPEAPGRALFASESRPHGSHCDMAEISRLGFRQHASHIPYWRNYMWPTPTKEGLAEGRPVRWHGSGALRWKPLLQGADAARGVKHARFENGCLSPDGAHNFCEVWYHIRIPYLISWVSVDYDVKGAGDDYFGISLSADGCRSWWQMDLPKGSSPHWGLSENGQEQWKAGTSSVQGLHEIWLRVDMVSHHEDMGLAMQALDLAVGFQHNMHLQPRLLPGENPLWLEAAAVGDGEAVEAEWLYQISGEERRLRLALDRAVRTEETVNVEAACPSEILMTGVKLRCL